jgi:hypothetical protein
MGCTADSGRGSSLLGYWEEEGDEGLLTTVSNGSEELGI